MVRVPHVDDRVQLVRDLPELSLRSGETGIVRTEWRTPYLAFEVEFSPVGQPFQTRCLLIAEQVRLAEDPPAA